MRIFERIGEFTYRYRWFVVGFWALILIASAFFAPNLGDRLKGGGFAGSNTEAERVQDIMVDDFGRSPATLTVVFQGDDGLSARGEQFQKAEQRALEDLRDLPETSFVATYSDTEDPRFISKDGEESYAVIGFNITVDETQNLVDEVRQKVRTDELTTYVTGAPAVYLDIQNASNEDIRKAEKYAFPLALVILVIAFGSFVAAGIPIMIGVAGVATTLSALYFLSGVYDMSIFTLSIATMLGLGLGIDYALFAVSRFREELLERPIEEAVPRMVSTAGRSIFFSGTAVLIGLSGLLFFPYMFMRSIGVAGVIVVFVSVLAALTLLPAALGILGEKVNALSIRRYRGFSGTRFWSRSAGAVMRHPWIVIIGVGAVLFTLLYPTTYMKVGIPEANVLPERYESRAGDNLLREQFDYAALNPVEVVATTESDPLDAESLAAVEKLGDRIGSEDGVERVESLYTVGADVARGYAAQITDAREQGQAEADRQVEQGVQQQLDSLRSQFGTLPPGAEEQVRAEAERRAAEELESQLPELPEGVSANGEVTPQGVANVLSIPEVRDSEEVRNALDTFVAGDQTLVQAVSTTNPYGEQARADVDQVRTVQAPSGIQNFLVGGLSAGQKDFIEALYGNAPYALAFVLGVTYLILFLTFRSFFIPLKAVIVNILSLTASFGAVVWVFQEGNLSGILNFTPLGFVDSTLPILMFSTIFGVSMDYEVFLLSRIREAYENGDSNTESVQKGLVSTAGIITSAAAIIIVVTGAFAFTGIIITKAIGLGLAVAVLVDASIIRIMLVPATMRVLGDWNWWPGAGKSVFKHKSK